VPRLPNRSGQRVTHRRYDYTWSRISQHHLRIAAESISTHWLRRTALAWVERHVGYAVARTYAGLNDRGSKAGVTTTYVRANIEESPRPRRTDWRATPPRSQTADKAWHHSLVGYLLKGSGTVLVGLLPAVGIVVIWRKFD
jgi:hypothetical protein